MQQENLNLETEAYLIASELVGKRMTPEEDWEGSPPIQKEVLDYLFRQVDEVVNSPYRESLGRYQEELANWRYRITYAGPPLGGFVGIAGSLYYSIQGFSQRGQIDFGDVAVAMGIFVGSTVIATGIGEIIARRVAKNRTQRVIF